MSHAQRQPPRRNPRGGGAGDCSGKPRFQTESGLGPPRGLFVPLTHAVAGGSPAAAPRPTRSAETKERRRSSRRASPPPPPFYLYAPGARLLPPPIGPRFVTRVCCRGSWREPPAPGHVSVARCSIGLSARLTARRPPPRAGLGDIAGNYSLALRGGHSEASSTPRKDPVPPMWCPGADSGLGALEPACALPTVSPHP